MAGETIQQIVDYLKANPDVAKKAKDYVKSHPDDVKAALKEVAEKRGWDLSKIDTAALKAEIGKMAA
jgi:tagatose-1,6-bisphosphate aldolase